MDESVSVRGRVVVVVENSRTGEKRVYEGKNLVTDAGDIHYAQHGGHQTPTNTFGIMELGTAHTGAPAKTHNRSNITVLASSQKAFDSTYPKNNDDDTDNTGRAADVVTYRVSYTTAEANGTITEIIITNVTPGASEPILTHADIASFTKTSSDTLKIFVNHTMNGV